MHTIYDLKPAFQNLLRPLTRVLAKNGITANQVTMAACTLSFLTSVVVFKKPDNPKILLVVPLVMFLRMALNAIDGMLAREHGMQTALGGILNELTDVLSDAALYLPFSMLSDVMPQLPVLVVLLAIISEMTGVVAVQVGASRRYDGPMGKSDRAFVFGTIALILSFGISPKVWVNVVLAATSVLLAITIVNRARKALLEINEG